MKNLKGFLFLIIVFTLLSGTCEKEEMPELPVCNCEIQGTKMISFDNGQTWQYNGLDERTGNQFPCSYDNTDTNQREQDGVLYKTHWECRNQ